MLQLEIEVIINVGSIRQANFFLFVCTLTNVCLASLHWDPQRTHHGYVFMAICNMTSLKDTRPCFYDQSLKRNFAAKKTTHNFSAMATEQAPKQINACANGDGSAVGLTENLARSHLFDA